MTQQTLPFADSDLAELQRQHRLLMEEEVRNSFTRHLFGAAAYGMLQRQIQPQVKRALRTIRRLKGLSAGR